MDSKPKYGSFEYINLDGKNTGATMRLHQRSFEGEPKDCFYINIYITNNVQAVSNSVLHDCEVKMRNPGVTLCFEDLKLGIGSPTTNKRVCWEEMLGLGSRLCVLLLFSSLFLFVLLALTRILNSLL
ncbi:hypothetical protein L6164_009933 [Bauhinia variegata]|uniref:Uncharacterized protein n=1 Tax=Bauhinia variegata TaxID=167791 RepID=A0ACB9PKQ0_BAUVA|nr:hypothetical protein L6164_009933 [Bauhinia variegata]